MKLSQLSILFVIIMITVVVVADISTNNLKSVASAKSDMDFYINQAIDNCALQLIQYDSSGDKIVNKEKAIESFFNSLYASLGILSDPYTCEQIMSYVPVMVVIMENGYYLMYQDIYKGQGDNSYVTKRWTEKIPYVYEDESFIYRLTTGNNFVIYDKHNLLDALGNHKIYKTDTKSIISDIRFNEIESFLESDCLILLNEEDFIEVRQQAIISQIEKDLSWYVSKHNQVAESLGITYNFGLPVINVSDWQKALEGTGVIVFIQGMPLIEDSSKVYNTFAFSGSGIRKRSAYFIKQKDWYFLYHKEGCRVLEDDLHTVIEKYDSVEECAQAGAYACEVCIPAGVYVPID